MECVVEDKAGLVRENGELGRRMEDGRRGLGRHKVGAQEKLESWRGELKGYGKKKKIKKEVRRRLRGREGV